jgi:hypothetical protein
MAKILSTALALALAAVVTATAPAGAAERRADGVRSKNATPTEFSSQRRRWRRGYRVRRAVWGPRYRYWRPRYRYAAWGYPGYGYGYGYGYPYYRAWRPFPVFGIGIGFGRRWWW